MDFKRIYEGVLAGAIFSFCLAPKLISLFVIILGLFTTYLAIKKEIKFRPSKVLMLIALFYFAYVFASFFTNHVEIALKYLEYKLVFILFPLLFSFQFKEKLYVKPLGIALILGVILSSFLLFYHSFKLYQLQGDFNNSFGSSSFSYIHHPTYFSAFVLFAICFAFYGYNKKWKYFSLLNLSLFVLYALVLQFLCFSFAGLIFLFLLILVCVYRIIFRKFRRIIFYATLIALPLFGFLMINSNIHVQITVNELFSDLKSHLNNPSNIYKVEDESEINGNKTRLIMWSATFSELKKYPFGVGTGNVDDVLETKLKKENLANFASKHYNPHNQFLQTGIEIGVFGLLILVVLIGYCVKVALQTKNYLLLILILNLAFNCLFESMLQRESGIVFYTFWICILASISDRPLNFKFKKLKT